MASPATKSVRVFLAPDVYEAFARLAKAEHRTVPAAIEHLMVLAVAASQPTPPTTTTSSTTSASETAST